MDDISTINYYDEGVQEEPSEQVSIQPDVYHNHIDILKNYDTIKKKNITRPRITKYELTKCLGMRAEMLAGGAEPLIEVPPYVTSVEEIAKLEFNQRKLPFILRRAVTGGFDYWKIEDLQNP